MTTFSLLSRVSAVTVLTLSLLVPQQAAAQGSCPPGTIPGGTMVPGQENAGWTACLDVGGAEDGGDDGDSGGGMDEVPPPFDAGEFAKLMAWEKANAEAAEAQRMQADPLYREMKQGVWKYTRSRAGDARQFCGAAFIQLNGGAMIMDWGGEHNGTFIAYFGGAIPPARAVKRVKVSLVQSGETQTVTAFHSALPWDKRIGMIVFAVPSTKALLGAIEDKQDYAVMMNGKPVIKGLWHSGAQARKSLSKCVSARR